MKPQTVNVIKEIVRYFIGCYNRGNAVTANTNTVHTEVCRRLHIVRQANKNNYRGLVIEGLRTLKKHIVLFETVTPKENDILNKAISIDNRTVYGLTMAVEDYLTRPSVGDNNNTLSDRYITTMLQHFNVLAKPAAPAAVEEVEIDMTNNVERLVATVRNASNSWAYPNTPADLLGGLYTLHQTVPIDTFVASAAKLNWPHRLKKHYSEACKFLIKHGLIESAAERKIKQSGREISLPHGIRLTPLGVEVAISGDFKDLRTEAKTKAGTMLKGQKQNPPKTPAVTASGADTQEMLRTIAALQERLSALEQQKKHEQPAEDPAEEPVEEPTHYDEPTTMSMILGAAIPAIIGAFRSVIDDPETTADPATHINPTGLYLTLTEIEETVRGIKAYASECIKRDEQIDIALIETYAADFQKAAAELERRHSLPVMGDQILVKRFLTGENAVKRPVWKRRTAVQA
jgi:hypothetical protein